MRNLLVIAALLVQPLSAEASGEGVTADPKDEILAPPPVYKGNDVTVVEKLGAKLPLEAKFRQHDGNVVTLGQVLDGELPTILTFNYSDCPMLCSLQLNGLSAVMPELAKRKDGALFWAGEQFRIVTISLDPDEDLVELTKMRDKYIARLPEGLREDARKGWSFLAAEHPGNGHSIKRVADAVGFSYTYILERAEWAHPASLIFVSTKGTVTRYVHGIEFDDAVMRESILKAGASEPASAIGFMNRCYHYDPNANNQSRAGVLALRVGAAGFVVLLLSGLGLLHVIRRNAERSGSAGPRSAAEGQRKNVKGKQ